MVVRIVPTFRGRVPHPIVLSFDTMRAGMRQDDANVIRTSGSRPATAGIMARVGAAPAQVSQLRSPRYEVIRQSVLAGPKRAQQFHYLRIRLTVPTGAP